MGKKSRLKREKRIFILKLTQYEKKYFSELRRLVSLSGITQLPLNLKPSRSVIYKCKDGYAIIRFPREDLPDKQEIRPEGGISVSDAINQYKFKSLDGEVNNVKFFPGPLNGMVATMTPLNVTENNKAFYADYHTVLVFGQELIGDPIKDAYKDFQTFIISRNFNIDPNLRNYNHSTIEKLERLLISFKDALKNGIREEVVQKFIDDHPIVLNPISLRHIPKMKIGKYFSDFTFVEVGNCYQFVEIERSDHPLLTKKLDFTKEVNHGWQQMEDWDEELESEKIVVESKYGIKNIENRRFTLIIGRSTSLDQERMQKLRTKSRTSSKYEILTYDDVLEKFRTLILNLKKT